MWREWLVLAAVFSCILTGLSLTLPTVSTAQPNQSTDLTPPAVTYKQMLCYGNLNLGAPYWSSNTIICSPGSQTFTNNVYCNTGDIMVGMQSSASWTSAEVDCQIQCATPSAPQSNCTWQ